MKNTKRTNKKTAKKVNKNTTKKTSRNTATKIQRRSKEELQMLALVQKSHCTTDELLKAWSGPLPDFVLSLRSLQTKEKIKPDVEFVAIPVTAKKTDVGIHPLARAIDDVKLSDASVLLFAHLLEKNRKVSRKQLLSMAENIEEAPQLVGQLVAREYVSAEHAEYAPIVPAANQAGS